MASIVISGDTSGTITVAAPAVAGSNTITMAAQTGTLNVAGPAFSAYQNGTTNPASNTWTKATIDTEEFDTNSNFDNTTNYRFTPTVAGYYQITAVANLSDVSNSGMSISIYKNGSAFKTTTNGTSGTQTTSGVVTALISMNGTTDYVEMWVNINGSATRAVTGGAANTYFQGCLVRGA